MTALSAPNLQIDGRPGERGPRRLVGFVADATERLANVRVWLPVAIAYAAFAVVFFRSSAPFSIPTVEAACGAPPPDVRVGATGAEVHSFLVSCGPAGRAAYQALQVADLVYPLLFAVFLASSSALVLRRLVPTRRAWLALAAIPFLASAFDYLENACAWLALAAYPSPAATDSLLGLASVAKAATSWAAGGVLIAGLAALLGRGAWRRTRLVGS